jgi:hypothetical protein
MGTQQILSATNSIVIAVVHACSGSDEILKNQQAVFGEELPYFGVEQLIEIT